MEENKLRLVNKIRDILSTRAGFFILTIVLFWLKTYWVYQSKFSLGITNNMQKFLLVVNPIPAALLIFGIALYFRGKKAYWIMMIINF